MGATLVQNMSELYACNVDSLNERELRELRDWLQSALESLEIALDSECQALLVEAAESVAAPARVRKESK